MNITILYSTMFLTEKMVPKKSFLTSELVFHDVAFEPGDLDSKLFVGLELQESHSYMCCELSFIISGKVRSILCVTVDNCDL